MGPIRFDTALATENDGFFIEIPDELIQELGGKKRPSVRATLNGYTYRTTISVYGGRSLIPVRKEIREAAGLTPGSPVTVTLELDQEPRTVEIPEDLARAFAGDPDAESAFQRLSYTHRKEYVNWITGAKREETRQRRIQRALDMLREGRREP